MRIINTTAFVLALVVVLSYYLFSVRKWKKTSIITEEGNDHIPGTPLVMTAVDVDTEQDDELVAIMTAAIHEFTGREDFQVVKIKQNRKNWTLTGWQDSLRNPR